MRPLLALSILILAGGYLPASSQSAPSAGDYALYGSTARSQPLHAAVWYDEYSGMASFDLNRPGYVAMFALQPMGRIELVYPTWGVGHARQRGFRAGRHSVRTDSRLYHLAFDRRYNRSPRRVSAQTYIVLIASDRPLRLEQFMAYGTLPWLDHPSITWNPFVATEHLAREVVPRYHAGDWTVAYHVVWPEASWNRYDPRLHNRVRERYTHVRCPGGIVISVPVGAVRSGAWSCPRRDGYAGPRAEPRRGAVPPVTEALPKRPRPTDWRGATPTDGVVRAVPRPDRGRPAAGGTPRVVPTADRPRPEARPPVGPQSGAKPGVRPQPQARPGASAKPAPSADPRPSGKPAPAARPRPPARPGPSVKPAPSKPGPSAKPSPPSKPGPSAKPAPRPKPGGGDG